MWSTCRQFKETDKIVGVFNTRLPQLLVTCPEYIYKIYATDFRNFHNNEWEKFVSINRSDRYYPPSASHVFFPKQLDKKTDKILGNNPFLLKDDEWKEKRSEITPGLSPNRVSS